MGLKPKDEQEKGNVVPLFQSGDYFFHRGIEAYRKNHLQRAIKLLERAVKITNTEPVFHVQLAAVLSEIGEYERSNEILQNVLTEKDDVAECYFFMANNYAYLGLFEKAEKMTLRYLELCPDDRFTNDANDLLELLRFEREEDDDWDDLEEDEDELIAQFERASYLVKQGEMQAAIAVLETIIDEHPTYWTAHNQLAEVLFRIGDASAFDICETVLEKDPGNLSTRCNLALFYIKNGDAKSAEPYIKSLCQVYPMDGDHYMKVAETLCSVGEYKAAYDRLKELTRWELEQKAELVYCFAVATYHCGDRKKVSPLCKRAEELGSKQAAATLALLEKGPVTDDQIRFDIWVD
ncbi:tetratricopeptide repeat protein [Alkalihalobacillus sp. MEB130]|uniref:tetratricopeptide repeat protein n=1 Tax=Alkalihalobacillus sp. MEB130 TaxID=2976704 RepID=UPI0028DE29C7|nr:tetratricopeptide repeat protein [Alkalihalobacillus sp. MEB130]MDT8858728.1 tetratricopeptide repeat protein [Alkalihalobacillus sp. MEB130]